MAQYYVSNFVQLQQAVINNASKITVSCNILCLNSLQLPLNCQLSGQPYANGEMPALFFNRTDGLGLSVNNKISDLHILCDVDKRAIYSASSAEDLGYCDFENLEITGQFSFITRTPTLHSEITMRNVHIKACDARPYLEQPQKYGVNVLQGALTIYNFNQDESSELKVHIEGLKIGSRNAPVIGSGIFIAGFGDQGGTTQVSKLHTYAVYSTGNIPVGVSDFITGAVFILNGTHAKEVIHDGEIITYGVNDMVLDAWGKVDSWISNRPIISYGPSGIGFVNFGQVGQFIVNDILETYGLGARGYNQYDGTVDDIRFKSITTYGDGSIGIQISKPIGTLHVQESVTTYGGTGNSLVKGHNVVLDAIALSVKEGGKAHEITIDGQLITHSKGIEPLSIETKAEVNQLSVNGKSIRQ